MAESDKTADQEGVRSDGPRDAQKADWAAVSTVSLDMGKRFGQLIGRYKIVRVLGEGGMGTVFLAEQDKPTRLVALKIIRAGVASANLLRRFEHESQVLGRLQHPGIAQIYEAGTADTGEGDQPYFVMEYVRGRSLMDYAQASQLGTRQRLELLAKICDAVQHAHQKGIIHRDLKPGNILVTEEGQPKILDFGVARATDADIQATTIQTDVGQLVGTIPYMSPEQAGGDVTELDTRSDVYALGVLGYELLAGRLPYDLSKKMIHEAVRVIREDDPMPLSSINRVFRGDVETIIAKALQKERTRRYQSASDLAGDIRRYLSDQTIVARPASVGYQLSKFAKRNKALVAGVAAVVLVSGIGTIVSVTFALGEAEQRKLAELRETDARSAKTLAEERRLEAQLETQKAEAYYEFLIMAFSAVDPRVDGREIRLIDVLDRAAARIPDEFREQPEIGASLQSAIGQVYLNSGLHELAEVQFDLALSTMERSFGSNHERTLQMKTNLVSLLTVTGRYDEAVRMGKPLVNQCRAALGNTHRVTLHARNNLAAALSYQGKMAEAAPIYREVAEISEREYGANDAETLLTWNNLAETLRKLDRLSEAEPILRRILSVQEQVLSRDHPDTMVVRANLATVLDNQGYQEEALPLISANIEMQRQVLGDTHPSTLASLNTLAGIQKRLGQLDAAEATWRQVFDGFVARGEEFGPRAIITLNNLATVLEAKGDIESAAEMTGRAIQSGRKLPGWTWQPSVFQSNYGGLLTQLERYKEAESELLASYDVLLEHLGSVHRHTRGAVVHLVELYDAWERPEQVAEWRDKLLDEVGADC